MTYATSRTFTTEYVIGVTFLDDGELLVQAWGDPYPLGLYKETGWDLDRLLVEAKDSIIAHRNKDF